MKFEEALKGMGQGYVAFRTSWLDESVIWLKPAAFIKAEWCRDPILKDLAIGGGGQVLAHGAICKAIMNNKMQVEVFTGWNPTAEDLYADDWQTIFHDEKLKK